MIAGWSHLAHLSRLPLLFIIFELIYSSVDGKKKKDNINEFLLIENRNASELHLVDIHCLMDINRFCNHWSTRFSIFEIAFMCVH